VFGFLRLIPGDPAVTMLGERATPENIARVREQLGLNKPLPEQYLIFLGNALRGDLGRSILRQEPVTQEIIRRFPATIELALAALLIAVVVGIPAGVISAVRRGSWFDSSSMLVALTGVSMPIFWLGLMLIYLFAVVLHLLPTGGRLDAGTQLAPITNLVLVDALLRGNIPVFFQGLRHLLLPALALGTIPMAIIARMTRSSMLEVLGQDYIRTAQAKGLKERTVVVRHALRNAWLPIITVVGLQVGILLSGAILTETVFSWPGIGRWLVDAIYARDYPIVQGVTLMIALIFVVVNLTVDILYALVDPRIRFE
jgi:peptide/nickel transport system permease protein